MELRLAGMILEESELERELAEKRLLVGNQADQLLELLDIYRAECATGMAAINTQPETPEQEQLQFETRRKFVERLVTRVDAHKDKSVTVTLEINLRTPAQDYPMEPATLLKPDQ